MDTNSIVSVLLQMRAENYAFYGDTTAIIGFMMGAFLAFCIVWGLFR